MAGLLRKCWTAIHSLIFKTHWVPQGPVLGTPAFPSPSPTSAQAHCLVRVKDKHIKSVSQNTAVPVMVCTSDCVCVCGRVAWWTRLFNLATLNANSLETLNRHTIWTLNLLVLSPVCVHRLLASKSNWWNRSFRRVPYVVLKDNIAVLCWPD